MCVCQSVLVFVVYEGVRAHLVRKKELCWSEKERLREIERINEHRKI